MSEKLGHILKRMNSIFLAKLWAFYREYFQNDNECLDFLYSTLKNTPEETVENKEDEKDTFVSASENVYYDRDYISRRMLFTVERFVSIAKNMENVRRGEDIFKIVYLISCVEALQKMSGKDCGKRKMLFDFFENYTSVGDKAFVSERFTRGSLGLYPDEETFFQFINALNEHRNFAVHDGEFYDFFFNNDDEQMPLSVFVKFDFSKMPSKLEKILAKSEGLEGLEKTDEYTEFLKRLENDPTIVYETTLSYRDFEKIFVRTGIEFIRRYVTAQEGIENV